MTGETTEPFSSTKGCRNEVDDSSVSGRQTTKIIWGFHQIYEFRETFEAIRFQTQFMEDTLMNLQNELMDLPVKDNSALLNY